MPTPEHEVTVQVAGYKAAGEAASKLAAQAVEGRQFFVQFAGGQEFAKQYAEVGQAIARQLAPMAAISKMIGASFTSKIAQDCGSKFVGTALFGIKPPSDIGTALFGKHIASNIGADYAKQFAGLTGIGKAVSGLAAASNSVRNFGKLLQDLERAKRGAIARYRRAAHLLNDLPDDATFGESRRALQVLAIGDTRMLARLMRLLARRGAQGDRSAAALLAWLGAILDLLAVHAFAQQLAAIVTIVDRSTAYHLGRLEWRLRAPDQRTDPVAHRHCANAPNVASAMEAVAA